MRSASKDNGAANRLVVDVDGPFPRHQSVRRNWMVAGIRKSSRAGAIENIIRGPCITKLFDDISIALTRIGKEFIESIIAVVELIRDQTRSHWEGVGIRIGERAHRNENVTNECGQEFFH